MSPFDSPLHRIPTLWSLYRPLLRSTRSAPLEYKEQKVLQRYIRDEFKRSTKLANIEKVKRRWNQAEQLLHQIEGSNYCTLHLNRLKELTLYLSNRSSLPLHPPPSPSPQGVNKKPSPRPTILHSTQFRPPMLRIRPQPIETSMMIFNRRKKSQKRFDKLSLAREYLQFMREEENFEKRFTRSRRGEGEGRWGEEWRDWIRDAREKEKKEQERNNMRVPEKLIERARRLNKKREEKRKTAGEGSSRGNSTLR
ncbi:hypothetical protein JCM3765_007354 [Sporobolomyces pararoseus]